MNRPIITITEVNESTHPDCKLDAHTSYFEVSSVGVFGGNRGPMVMTRAQVFEWLAENDFDFGSEPVIVNVPAAIRQPFIQKYPWSFVKLSPLDRLARWWTSRRTLQAVLGKP